MAKPPPYIDRITHIMATNSPWLPLCAAQGDKAYSVMPSAKKVA